MQSTNLSEFQGNVVFVTFDAPKPIESRQAMAVFGGKDLCIKYVRKSEYIQLSRKLCRLAPALENV